MRSGNVMVQVIVHRRVEVVLPEGVKEITLGYAQIEESGCPFFTRTSKIVKKSRFKRQRCRQCSLFNCQGSCGKEPRFGQRPFAATNLISTFKQFRRRSFSLYSCLYVTVYFLGDLPLKLSRGEEWCV